MELVIANFKNSTDAAAKAEAAKLNAMGEIKKLRDGLVNEEFELRSEAAFLKREHEAILQIVRETDAEIIAGAEERLAAMAVLLKGDTLKKKRTASAQAAQVILDELEVTNADLLEKREALNEVNAVFAGDVA